MPEERRSECRLQVSRDMVQISYQGDRGDPLKAHAFFDHQAALQLSASLAKTDPHLYGRALYDLLLMADPRQRVSSVFARSFDDPDARVQVALELVDETLAGLLTLRWEALCDPDGRHLALDSRFRLVRRLASLPPRRGYPLGDQPRVLVVISNPDNLESFSVPSTGQEKSQSQSFAPIEPPFLPQQTLVAPPN